MRILLSFITWGFLFSVLLQVDNNICVQAECLEDQKTLLVQLNQSLVSSSSTSKRSSWSPDTDCCSSWDGVTCDTSGHVLSLDLSNESIEDGVNSSSSLFKFRYLERLNLAFNYFGSIPIPAGFDRLVNLTYLNLSNSGFNGQIPISFSRMTRLVTFDLATYQFPGSIPFTLNNPDLNMLTRNLKELRVLSLDGVNISAHGSKWCKALSSSVPKLQVLSLSNCYLSGPFDKSLTQLQSLYEIRLSGNNISGEVPEFFSEFRNLTFLDLSSCELHGNFPERILKVGTLEKFYLANNDHLQGSLPEFPMHGLLQELILFNTSFSGDLPDSIGNLILLSRLDLWHCRFNGSIPASVSQLKQLQYLDLSENSFTGTLPMALFAIPSLQYMDLSENQFTGQLGEFFNGSLSSLETLDLSMNKLQGPIPATLFELSKLDTLALSSNNFNGIVNLDALFSKLNNLTDLDLSNNRLSVISSSSNPALFLQIGFLALSSCNLTKIPSLLKNTELTTLDLSNNQIQGKIPNWIWEIGDGSLDSLNLSRNLLEDPDRPFPANSFTSIKYIDLHSNMLQGKNPILPPSALFLDYSSNNLTSIIPNASSYLSNAMFFSLSNNQINGEIPASICEASLEVLDLSFNNLSGPVPPCLKSMARLRVLNLRRNSLSGQIPHVWRSQGSIPPDDFNSYPESCDLRTFNLNENKFEGQLPSSLANCTMLEVLDVGNNQLTGGFPSWLGSMPELRVLVLQNNRFQGPLGNGGTVCNLAMLQIIDISSNKFSGNLPKECFSSWKTMMVDEQEAARNHRDQIIGFGFAFTDNNYQQAVTVTSKGQDMDLVKILIIFTSIDFSNNNFEGEIPDIIGNFTSLNVLNFSSNAFEGKIPSTLGKLKNLESLDLSSNKLSGEIPYELAGLSFLAVLNLSFNKLVGRIPPGSQFQTYQASSFEGNDGLCGSPLLKNCSSTEEAPQDVLTSDNEPDWILLAVTFSGCLMGIGMVVGPQCFWKKGRKYADKLVNKIITMKCFACIYKFPRKRK
ncbi:receptor-like protein 33 [Papaver somniferum]|uniref:receptor-like protein 33 n=1 Tax=Papaver somniferum TaxID=3469 RepID=UPI000E704FA7|nr:receptor-like protein 33 [Papaver somniferum]